MFISTIGHSVTALQVTPAMMELDNYYVVEMPGYDDISGEEMFARDFIWFYMDQVPGQAKAVKVCRFCSCPKALTFGQMPGAKFFGPISIVRDDTGSDMLLTEKEEKSQDKLGAILRKQANL